MWNRNNREDETFNRKIPALKKYKVEASSQEFIECNKTKL